MSDSNFEYIICGAGIAGLYSAISLNEKYNIPGDKILVLEKSYRVGGKVHTLETDVSLPDGKKEHIVYECGAGRFKKEHLILMELINKYKLQDKIYPIPEKKDFKIVYRTGPIQVNNNIFKQMLNSVLNGSYNEFQLRSKTFRSLMEEVVGFEKTRIFIEYFGYNSEISNVNAYDGLRIFKTDFNQYSQYFVLQGGLEQITKKMQEDCKNKGIKILTSTKIINYSFNNELFTVNSINFEQQNKDYICKKLVLAFDKRYLKSIKALNPIKNLINSVNVCSLTRIYAVFPKDEQTGKVWFSGIPKTTTNLPIRQVIPINEEQGLIMISYSDDYFAKQWQQYFLDGQLENMILKYIRRMFPTKEIPKPLFLQKLFWINGTHLWKVNTDSNDISNRILKPFDYPLFICGETYSLNQGWIEGALDTAKQAIELAENNKNIFEPKIFTLEEVSKSNNLTIINDNVYDLTKNDWINKHPGGDVIKKAIGIDATNLFQYIQHPEYAKNILEELYVGKVNTNTKLKPTENIKNIQTQNVKEIDKSQEKVTNTKFTKLEEPEKSKETEIKPEETIDFENESIIQEKSTEQIETQVIGGYRKKISLPKLFFD